MILEAMASGTPVVASDIGGIKDIIIDGKGGYLCPVGDVDCFTHRMKELLTDKNLLKEQSKLAINRAKKFSREEMLSRYEYIFSQVIENSLKMWEGNYEF